MIGEKFNVLDDGFVILVDYMGCDEDVAEAARTSYQKGTKKVNTNEGLIRYLMRHRHTTPFEMCELKFLVRVPMDCWRQWIRHRTASVNEYSTRYSEAIDSQQITEKWRAQSTINKQGSQEGEIKWPEGYQIYTEGDGTSDEFRLVDEMGYTMYEGDTISPQDYLQITEKALLHHANATYKERLKFGVAREQARKDLPLSTYTEAYWKIDLHNLFHFLSLRMDSHAQLEIRTYANKIGEIVANLFPICWSAFCDYRLNAMFLSAVDIAQIQNLFEKIGVATINPEWIQIENKREREECLAKLQKLGFFKEVRNDFR